MTAHYPQSTPGSRYQAGVMTTFTGVLILVLLTLMMFFAMRVGVFEQRVYCIFEQSVYCAFEQSVYNVIEQRVYCVFEQSVYCITCI